MITLSVSSPEDREQSLYEEVEQSLCEEVE